jgi:hypothetical protein
VNCLRLHHTSAIGAPYCRARTSALASTSRLRAIRTRLNLSQMRQSLRIGVRTGPVPPSCKLTQAAVLPGRCLRVGHQRSNDNRPDALNSQTGRYLPALVRQFLSCQ